MIKQGLRRLQFRRYEYLITTYIVSIDKIKRLLAEMFVICTNYLIIIPIIFIVFVLVMIGSLQKNQTF